MATREATKRENKRTPVDGYRNKLKVSGTDPDYVYYIATDKDGNVENRVDRGWEVVTDAKVTIGQKRISTPTQEGSAKTVSVGGGETGVLMRLPKGLYEEDVAYRNKLATEAVKQVKKDARDSSDYGKLDDK